MSFWNVTNPAKPKGIKDPNAVLDFPISFAAWLADVSDSYASHQVLTTDGETLSTGAVGSLVCASSTQSGGSSRRSCLAGQSARLNRSRSASRRQAGAPTIVPFTSRSWSGDGYRA